MVNEYKEVYYHVYCEQCKHVKVPEHEDPCDECLHEPVNAHSHKPVKFEEKEN